MTDEGMKELSFDDLEGVAGGVTREPEYVSNDGSDECIVKCPFCSFEGEPLDFGGVTVRGDNASFICSGCGSPFQYRITRKTLNSRTGVWRYEISNDSSRSPAGRG